MMQTPSNEVILTKEATVPSDPYPTYKLLIRLVHTANPVTLNQTSVQSCHAEMHTTPPPFCSAVACKAHFF
jgi:hypothetical protein